MPKKKLYRGSTIEVDPQIIRWQKKLKQLGVCHREPGPGRPKRYKKMTSAERELADIMKARR